jgi:nucleoside phosphorylase
MSGHEDRFDLVVLAAHVPDLQGMRRHVGRDLHGTIGGLRLICRAAGMGLGTAGAATMRRLLRTPCRGVLFLGTCGIYPGLPDYQPHDVVVASTVKLLDHAALAHQSAYPEPMVTEATPHPLLAAGLTNVHSRARQVPVASPLAHTVSDQLAAAVPGALGCHAENLEAFAVAHACASMQVPFAAVLGVTHIVGARGFDDWKRFERVSTTVAADLVATWIHKGAAGLPHTWPSLP